MSTVDGDSDLATGGSKSQCCVPCIKLWGEATGAPHNLGNSIVTAHVTRCSSCVCSRAPVPHD